jgi:AcrR family transcriptional regulator
MTQAPPPLGRRERNKQAKFERIAATASALFDEHGVDGVTTQQLADAADIGTGTLFLYARTKGELLLLVQNVHYADALEQGQAAAADRPDALEAVLALVNPIVACNRRHVGNGRTYLREMAFGDAGEPHHAEALAIAGRTEQAVADLLLRRTDSSPEETATLARVVSAVLFVTMAGAIDPDTSVSEVLQGIRAQLAAILP